MQSKWKSFAGRACARQDGARHPRKWNGILRANAELTFAFINRYRRVWPTSVQYQVLEASVTGYKEHFVGLALPCPAAPPQRRCAAGAYHGHPRRNARRLRLAEDVEGTTGQGHSGGQGSGPQAHAAAWHPDQGQAPLQGHDGPTSYRLLPTCWTGGSAWPNPTGIGPATPPISPPPKADCSSR